MQSLHGHQLPLIFSQPPTYLDHLTQTHGKEIKAPRVAQAPKQFNSENTMK